MDHPNHYPEDERSAPVPGRSRRGGSQTTSLILSAIALVIACTALLLQLIPRLTHEKSEEAEEPQEVKTIYFRDRALPLLEGVPVNKYDAGAFYQDDDGFLRCGDAPIGIDVSSYQGEIDWRQVAEAGVRFAMIRAGYRGYTKGKLIEDDTFRRNIEGALDAGVEVGVYIFSQAISVWEAEEEAEYVLGLIRGYDVTYPIAYDWEPIESGIKARTDDLSGEELTRCAGAFCDAIAAAGYTPVVYFNLDQGYLTYQLDRLAGYSFWLAEYQSVPSFYYRFDFWQYTHKGSVPGISTDVDLDLDLRGQQRG